MEISIIIPVYNEEKKILNSLQELENYMMGYSSDGNWEAIVVNDGSSDNTVQVLNPLRQKKDWLRVIDIKIHYGRGRALRTGIEMARGEIIVSLDADLSYAPYHIDRMIKKIKDEGNDIVLASAYGKRGTVKNVPLKRLLISKIGNKILSYMFSGDLTVLTCLVRAYKAAFIKRLDLNSDDKDIHLEILYKARLLGGRIVEVPADLCWREDKIAKAKSSVSLGRRSTVNIRKTSSSHLFFALLNRPGIIFWIPGYLLLFISGFIFLIAAKYILLDIISGTPFYFAIRNSMLNARLSWLTMVVLIMLGIQFFTLGFLTNQNKNNYEEIYKTLHAIFAELKEKK